MLSRCSTGVRMRGLYIATVRIEIFILPTIYYPAMSTSRDQSHELEKQYESLQRKVTKELSESRSGK
jgi:hypothetical protein